MLPWCFRSSTKCYSGTGWPYDYLYVVTDECSMYFVEETSKYCLVWACLVGFFTCMRLVLSANRFCMFSEIYLPLCPNRNHIRSIQYWEMILSVHTKIGALWKAWDGDASWCARTGTRRDGKHLLTIYRCNFLYLYRMSYLASLKIIFLDLKILFIMYSIDEPQYSMRLLCFLTDAWVNIFKKNSQ
jgi:hypothetical protein